MQEGGRKDARKCRKVKEKAGYRLVDFVNILMSEASKLSCLEP